MTGELISFELQGGVMQNIGGYVRFRFRSDDDDIDVILEGEYHWVKSLVDEIGMEDVGWMMPLAVDSADLSSYDFDSELEPKESGAPKDMGPPPDPSRIPVIRRPIGELDMKAKLAETGILPAEKVGADVLREELEMLEEPMPVQGEFTVDPMAEAWLKELLRIVVRKHGLTALNTEDIALAASDYLGDREGIELEVYLESLFNQGKLVKIHGGHETAWGPSPSWLASR